MAADLHYAPLPVPVIELIQKRQAGLRRGRTPARDAIRYTSVTDPANAGL